MQANIHPQYGPSELQCACGHTFTTRSTKKVLKVEICSKCHPFFTGQHKFVDQAGRIERFNRKYNKNKIKADQTSSLANDESSVETTDSVQKSPVS